MTFGILLILVSGTFIVGLLIALALGVQMSSAQDPHARWVAVGLLALLGAFVVYVIAAGRWDRKHPR